MYDMYMGVVFTQNINVQQGYTTPMQWYFVLGMCSGFIMYSDIPTSTHIPTFRFDTKCVQLIMTRSCQDASMFTYACVNVIWQKHV